MPLHVKFVTSKVELGQVFLRALVSPVSIIPPTLHTHSPLHVALTGLTTELQLRMLFCKSENTGQNALALFSSSRS